jgi:acyl-CoA synthetase (AMP-forming)/AMP-acid ligase II
VSVTKTLSSVLQPASKSDIAVIAPDIGAWSYDELGSEIERIADILAANGVETGMPVSIVLTNGYEFVATFLAVAHAGAIAAPLNPAYTADEFAFYMEDAGARVAILPNSDHPARKAAAALGIKVVEAGITSSDGHLQVTLTCNGYELTSTIDASVPSDSDVALFLHTSGTTSRPKGVPLRHLNLMQSVENIKNTYALAPDDTSLIVMPLFHVHGLIGACLSTLNSGGTIVVPPRFSASAFWKQQADSGSTWYSAVPTIHQILLARADDDDAPHEAFRFIRSCSAALAPTVFDALEDRFKAPVLEAYGMTEASHQMSSSPLPPGARIPGTVGIATGVEIAIMADENSGLLASIGERGEVVIKGRNVMWGYHNNEEANADAFVDGWFRTGDQGLIGDDGYLTLTGRLKELINRGGEKISPLEVDAALLEHPAIAEAVCFAAPDEKYGECVQAAVVLSGDCEQDDIQDFCRERLADFKVPDIIYFADKLPRTATGKIQRRHVATAFLGDD